MERMCVNHNQKVLYRETHFQEKEKKICPSPSKEILLFKNHLDLSLPVESTQKTCCADELPLGFEEWSSLQSLVNRQDELQFCQMEKYAPPFRSVKVKI